MSTSPISTNTRTVPQSPFNTNVLTAQLPSAQSTKQNTTQSTSSVFNNGSGSIYQIAQAQKPTLRPADTSKWTKQQWGDAIREWEAQKKANPTSLNNILANKMGMSSDEILKQMAAVGVSVSKPEMKGKLDPLNIIATLSGYQSPASLGSNWEQKTAFMTLWVRKTTNEVAAATQQIQVVNQLYQARVITANDARLRIAGLTLRAQTESLKLNTFNDALGQLNLKLGTTETALALENLKLQVKQNQLSISTALKTASTNLDTINKTVGNQAAGVRNTAVANIQQLDNLRLQGLVKIRAVAVEPRSTTGSEGSGVLEFDKTTGAALPMVPTRDSTYLSQAQTKALVAAVMPVINNGKPAELRTSPTPGVGISPSEASNVAAADRNKLQAATGDLKRFASLSEQQFKAKFGTTRAQAQQLLNQIRNRIPVAVDTKNLLAATSSIPQPEYGAELATVQAAARAADIKPETKKYIESLNAKTYAQLNYVAQVWGVRLGAKIIGGVVQSGGLGRGAAANKTFGKGVEGAKKIDKFLPQVGIEQLNNLYGQLARVGNLEQTVITLNQVVEGRNTAAQGLALGVRSYEQAVKGITQTVEQNKVAVANYQTNYKDLQTRLNTVQARLSTLDTNDLRLVTSKQAVDIAQKVSDISLQTAGINNKVAAQAGRITTVTGENNTFTANLNNVVSAGQDYNTRSLGRAFVQAPTAVVMTDKGLVVPQKLLYAAYAEVRAKAGANASAIRYDTPAVLSLARAKTHQDFKAGYPSAAAVLLTDKPNSVSLASINILRDGKYDAARALMPANLKARPSASYALPNVPTRIVWGSGAVPAWVSAKPTPLPKAEPAYDGQTQAEINNVLGGSSTTPDTEPPKLR